MKLGPTTMDLLMSSGQHMTDPLMSLGLLRTDPPMRSGPGMMDPQMSSDQCKVERSPRDKYIIIGSNFLVNDGVSGGKT